MDKCGVFSESISSGDDNDNDIPKDKYKDNNKYRVFHSSLTQCMLCWNYKFPTDVDDHWMSQTFCRQWRRTSSLETAFSITVSVPVARYARPPHLWMWPNAQSLGRLLALSSIQGEGRRHQSRSLQPILSSLLLCQPRKYARLWHCQSLLNGLRVFD